MKKKRWKVVVWIVIIFAIVLFYGIRYANTPVQTEAICYINYEESVSGDALIIRRETLNTAPVSGTIYNYVSSGERVAKNSSVASVYNDGVSSEVLQELNNVNKKIKQLNTENYANQETLSVTTLSDESKIGEYKDGIIDAAYNRDISAIAKYKDSIKTVKNGQINADDGDELIQLQEKKEQLEKKIGNSKTDIVAQSSGLYITGVDGCENTLTPESIDGFTVSDFNNVSVNSYNAEDNVVSGENVSKIVDNHVWYAMVKVNAKYLKDSVKQGSKVEIRFEDLSSNALQCEIYHISEEENGEVLVTVKCEKYLEGIFDKRKINAELIFENYSGYKIPTYALRTVSGSNGTDQYAIEVQQGTGRAYKVCEILYQNNEEGFVIIDSPDDATSKIKDTDMIYIGEK